jgi:hypothetical protein
VFHAELSPAAHPSDPLFGMLRPALRSGYTPRRIATWAHARAPRGAAQRRS